MRTAVNPRNAIALACALIAVAVFNVPTATAATPAPAWALTSLATPTNFIPGDTGDDFFYDVRLTNVGAEASNGSPITITDVLPAGIMIEKVDLYMRTAALPLGANPVDLGAESYGLCTTDTGPPAAVSCTIPEAYPDSFFGPTSDTPSVVQPGEDIHLAIHFEVPAGTSAGTVSNHVEAQGGGALPASLDEDNAVTDEGSPQPPASGFSFARVEITGPDGQPVTEAAAHPYQYTTSYAVNTEFGKPGSGAAVVAAGGDIKDIPVALPPGLVGNPTGVAQCKAQQFTEVVKVEPEAGALYATSACPAAAAIGFVRILQNEFGGIGIPIPVYNLVPPPGEPAQFGFLFESIPFYIDTEVRPDQNYRIVAGLRNQSEIKRVTAASLTLWGVPSDPSHDPIRGRCLSAFAVAASISAGNCAGDGSNRALLRLPTSCNSALDFQMGMDTWVNPGALAFSFPQVPALTGCDQVPFEPALKARPVSNVSDSPTELEADLHIPQSEEAGTRGEADLRRAVVTLPDGLVVNPSGANGLGACSESQIGYLGRNEGSESFSNRPAACPDDAKIGTAEVDTPLVDHPLKGSVYVARPYSNPFHSLLALYIGITDPTSGVVVKLAGDVEADPHTGQLTTTFMETPQLPFKDFKLNFFGGAGAALRSPSTCGSFATRSQLTAWSQPASAPPNLSVDSYTIEKGPGGKACPMSQAGLENAPDFVAGSESAAARAFSPLTVHLSREDGSQEISSVSVNLPPGLLAKLRGVPYCSEAALAAAGDASGRTEEANASCPPASLVGTVKVGAGAGPKPLYVDGNVYLAGPYQGAPLSLAIVTPAVAGPYDLGTVVVRSAIQVNPESAEVTAVADHIPRILQGIPLDLRSIDVRVDRPGFTLNPTDCSPMAIRGQAVSVLDEPASLSQYFQVERCGRLAFGPRLTARFFGKTNRTAHPRLRVMLRMPQGDEANIARAAVLLPRSELLDQAHIRTVCTRVQYAAADCPKGAIYGYAKAWSPLLNGPLEGPVYLRSNGGDRELPDLVASLDGQIHIDLVGYVDAVKQRIRTRFALVPDAPISKFVLSMDGRRRGLLENKTNICGRRLRATFVAHNGKVRHMSPVLRNKRCNVK